MNVASSAAPSAVNASVNDEVDGEPGDLALESAGCVEAVELLLGLTVVVA